MSRRIGIIFALTVFLASTACHQIAGTAKPPSVLTSSPPAVQRTTPINSPLIKRVVDAALNQTKHTLYYDPSYVQLEYPGGDVPLERGACTDVIIRAFRKADVDLQKEVHEDMLRNFSAYPRKWGLTKPDANIDHRRVPNLMVYFQRQGKALAVSTNAQDYLPGDVVAWDLGGGTTHIGLVTNIVSETTGNHQIAHNIGAGVRVEDVLRSWRIIGHYRYF